ncbi:hypothetical protein Tco_1385592 [Tanacetum coccineum]
MHFRSKLQLADATGIHNLSDADIYAGLATLVGMLQRFGEGVEGDQITTKELILRTNWVNKVNSLENALNKEIQESNCVRIQKVKNKRIRGEVSDINPLVSLVKESMKEKSTDFVTPTKASGEAQEEEISATILEAAKTLSNVASQGVSKEKSTDKGKRYRRRAREQINTGIEEVSTGSTKIDSGTASKRSQREGKATMIEEDIQATHKTKEQLRQEEARLEEAIKLQAQLDEEVAKQIHLDKMIAQRMAEEEALTEQQKKRKLKFNFEKPSFKAEGDWGYY